MKTPEKAEFERVRAAAEAACVMAAGWPGREFCANVADLHCVEVGWLLAEDGSARWLVEVEEASPDDWRLRRWLEKQLAEKGITAAVETNW